MNVTATEGKYVNKPTFDFDVVQSINEMIDERIQYLANEVKTREEIIENQAFVNILQKIFDKFCSLDTDNMDYKELSNIYKGMFLCVSAINEGLVDSLKDAAAVFDAE